MNGFSEKVYPNETKIIIEETRVVLDLKHLALKIREENLSPVNIFYLFFPRFKNAVNNIPIKTLQEVSEDDLRFQYRLFFRKTF